MAPYCVMICCIIRQWISILQWMKYAVSCHNWIEIKPVPCNAGMFIHLLIPDMLNLFQET